MPENPGKADRTFKTNIDALLDELGLAYHWQRPSLLLTVHKSMIGQKKARENLAKKLKKKGWGVIEIQIDEANPDAAQRILEFSEPQKFVFFVSGLERGGGVEGKDAYRALNLARESFVEQQLKVVFWLSVNEANTISRLAPDFWAFRHRVIEFASPAPRLTAERLTALLTWHAPEMAESSEALHDKIRNEERLLAELPKAQEALSMRIETCYLLGQAYWTAGDADKALKALMAGIGLAQDKDFAHLNSWLLNGVAIVQHERGKYQDALEILQDLARHDRNDGIAEMNLAVALCSVGKNHEGLTQGMRAAGMPNPDPRLFRALGHLELALGRLDEAAADFEKSVEVLPQRATSHEALAACYFRMGLVDEALAEIELAKQYSESAYERAAIFAQAILGNIQEALKLLEAAAASGQVSAAAIRHDANLHSVIDPVLIAAILQRQ
jgi:tetratricopeptide (TPR) repeat protein